MPCPVAPSPRRPSLHWPFSPISTASIIIQLLTVAIPALERLARRRAAKRAGRRSQASPGMPLWSWALLQGFGYYILLRNAQPVLTSSPVACWICALSSSCPLLPAPLSSCGWASRSLSLASATVFPLSCLPASSPACPVHASALLITRLSGDGRRYQHVIGCCW